MKTNKKGFIWSVVLFVISTILILQLGILESPKKAPQEFLLLFLSLQAFSVILLIVNPFKKPKPNYDCSEMEEKTFFKVLEPGPIFLTDNPETSGFMIIKVEGFGTTVMRFPKDIQLWQEGRFPEKGERYIKVGKLFIRVFQ